MATLKIHAFQVILAGNVVSICDRYPGYDHVATDDADVTCKDCLKEMDGYRMGVRTRELDRRAREGVTSRPGVSRIDPRRI